MLRKRALSVGNSTPHGGLGCQDVAGKICDLEGLVTSRLRSPWEHQFLGSSATRQLVWNPQQPLWGESLGLGWEWGVGTAMGS